MTPWLALVNGLLSLANAIAGYLSNAQLLEAGKALEQASNLKRALDEVRRANAARDVIGDRMRSDPNWLPDNDPNRRD